MILFKKLFKINCSIFLRVKQLVKNLFYPKVSIKSFYTTANENSSYRLKSKHSTRSPFEVVVSVYFFLYFFVNIIVFPFDFSLYFNFFKKSLFFLWMLFFGNMYKCSFLVSFSKCTFLLKFLNKFMIILYIYCIFTILRYMFIGFFGWIRDLWYRDDSYINKELDNLGYFKVERLNFIGFNLFLLSELLIFGGLFWTLFFNMCAPMYSIGHAWPPLGIPAVAVFKIPLINTLFLILSGFTITVAHKMLMIFHSKYLYNKTYATF